MENEELPTQLCATHNDVILLLNTWYWHKHIFQSLILGPKRKSICVLEYTWHTLAYYFYTPEFKAVMRKSFRSPKGVQLKKNSKFLLPSSYNVKALSGNVIC